MIVAASIGANLLIIVSHPALVTCENDAVDEYEFIATQKDPSGKQCFISRFLLVCP